MLHRAHTLDRQVVVADLADQEGLSRLNGARVVRLEANGRLAIHPDRLISTVLPQVVVLLHPVLGSLRITGARVVRLVIPLPRGTTGDVGPRVIRSSVVAAKPRTKHVVVALDTVPRHARHDAVADEVVVLRGRRRRRVIGNARSHLGVDLANLDAGGGGLLGGLSRLGGGDLGDDQRAGGSCHDGQGGQGAGGDSCSLGPRVACARSTRCH